MIIGDSMVVALITGQVCLLEDNWLDVVEDQPGLVNKDYWRGVKKLMDVYYDCGIKASYTRRKTVIDNCESQRAFLEWLRSRDNPSVLVATEMKSNWNTMSVVGFITNIKHKTCKIK